MRSTTRLLGATALGAAAAATVFVAVGASGAATGHGAASAASVPKTAAISHSTPALTASEVYKRDSSGVVAISATSATEQDTGTGVVLNTSGLILTNDHVVSGAQSVTVAPGTSPNTTRTATVVGEDPDSDLAVLKIDPSGLGLTPLTFANSSGVSVGDPVYAIGNPYGLDETLTRGIVSALGRQISAPDGATINDAIQTDAALNPGNSGGPLIDAQGDVIGINSQIASEETSGGGQPGSTGVGFAISSNTAMQVAQQIETSGSVPSTQSQSSSGQTQSGESPYGGGQSGTDPYGGSQSGGSQSSGTDPYGGGGQSSTSPYGDGGGGSTSPYGDGGGQSSTSPYGSGYGYGSSTDPYGYGSSSGAGSGGGTILLP